MNKSIFLNLQCSADNLKEIVLKTNESTVDVVLKQLFEYTGILSINLVLLWKYYDSINTFSWSKLMILIPIISASYKPKILYHALSSLKMEDYNHILDGSVDLFFASYFIYNQTQLLSAPKLKSFDIEKSLLSNRSMDFLNQYNKLNKKNMLETLNLFGRVNEHMISQFINLVNLKTSKQFEKLLNDDKGILTQESLRQLSIDKILYTSFIELNDAANNILYLYRIAIEIIDIIQNKNSSPILICGDKEFQKKFKYILYTIATRRNINLITTSDIKQINKAEHKTLINNNYKLIGKFISTTLESFLIVSDTLEQTKSEYENQSIYTQKSIFLIDASSLFFERKYSKNNKLKSNLETSRYLDILNNTNSDYSIIYFTNSIYGKDQAVISRFAPQVCQTELSKIEKQNIIVSIFIKLLSQYIAHNVIAKINIQHILSILTNQLSFDSVASIENKISTLIEYMKTYGFNITDEIIMDICS